MVDLALRLLREGYDALHRDRLARGGHTSYASRLLGRRAVVLGDAAGARLFYDESVVSRTGAVPPPLAWLLFGRGAVHGLDDDPHRARKQLFLDVLGPGQVAHCARLARIELQRAAAGWGDGVSLHEELVDAYGAAVVHWAGVPVGAQEARRAARSYARIVDGFGFAGPAYLRAWRARRQTDAWARRLVQRVRTTSALRPRSDSVMSAIARSDLDDRTAAVELGNVLRPTVAVSWLGAFAAAAMGALHDDERRRLADPADDDARLAFVQEVRRTAPFVPALAGRVRRNTTHGYLELRRGDRMVLDVRAIDLDPNVYADPLAFDPQRFRDRAPGEHDLVPQGGGPPLGHRCPGESMAVQLLMETVAVLARLDLEIGRPDAPDLTRIPPLPPGGPRVRVRGAAQTELSASSPSFSRRSR